MRDSRGRSRSPRRIAAAVGRVRSGIEPATSLAAVERVWADVVGAAVAAVARPVSERDGVLTVTCEGAVWAQELSLMESKIRARLAAEIGEKAPTGIRFRTG